MAVDLDLVGYRFNWASSIFYIVYLLVEVPSNIILKKVGPKYYCMGRELHRSYNADLSTVPFLVVGFGLVSMCTAFVDNFAQLCTARAFLGI